MMLYEILDMTEAKTIIVCNKPYDVTFCLLQIDDGDTANINTLIYDEIESEDVTGIVVDNDTMYVYIDKERMFIENGWDGLSDYEQDEIDFYDLEHNQASPEMGDLARSLGIYVL